MIVVNVDVKDNHNEAATAAPQALRLCQLLEDCDDVHSEIDRALIIFGKTMNKCYDSSYDLKSSVVVKENNLYLKAFVGAFIMLKSYKTIVFLI